MRGERGAGVVQTARKHGPRDQPRISKQRKWHIGGGLRAQNGEHQREDQHHRDRLDCGPENPEP